MYLFMEDICGEKERSLRHVKAYCNLYEMREKIRQERIRALKKFRLEVMDGKSPSAIHTAAIESRQFSKFENKIEELCKPRN